MPTTAGYSETHRVADLRTCRAMLAGGSRSFYAASFLLPRRVRDAATALYAFCRLADDAVDVGEGGATALAQLYDRLDRAYRGHPIDNAADRAFADVVSRYGVPRALPEALIDGFAWDEAQRTYESIDELLGYAARVAGTVGAMMSLLMGRREPEIVARACDLGMAMQLTNIARDVGEDARNGRLYLPRAWLREEGIDPDAWLLKPQFTPQIARIVGRLLATADDLYTRADAGIARLPPDCRPGITAARLLYAEIGREVERRGWDSISSRAVVPGSRKLGLLFSAINSIARTPEWSEAHMIEASRFLIDAAVAPSGHHPALVPIAWWDVRGRLMFVLDLFERLERRERNHKDQAGQGVRARQPATA